MQPVLRFVRSSKLSYALCALIGAYIIDYVYLIRLCGDPGHHGLTIIIDTNWPSTYYPLAPLAKLDYVMSKCVIIVTTPEGEYGKRIVFCNFKSQSDYDREDREKYQRAQARGWK